MPDIITDNISLSLSILSLLGVVFAIWKQWVIRGVVDEDLIKKYKVIESMLREAQTERTKENDKRRNLEERVSILENNLLNHQEAYRDLSHELKGSVKELSTAVHELKGVVDSLARMR